MYIEYPDHILREADCAFIPKDSGNADYEGFLDWLERGNVPATPPPPAAAPVPSQITMRQARLALLSAGKLANVDAAIATLPSPARETAEIEWQYASTVERVSPIVALLGPALGLDDDELDSLFAMAAQL